MKASASFLRGCAPFLLCSALGGTLPTQALAFDARPVGSVAAKVQVAFTPGDDAAAQIIGRIAAAKQQIHVQAFSFTHDGIAHALIEAHNRGVDVRLIADREQTEKISRSQVPVMARAGIPVWLDDAHLGAHNKVMVIDAALPSAVVITGSYNFTRAAQYKNAENVLFISDNAVLAQSYLQNWQRHLQHSRPLSPH